MNERLIMKWWFWLDILLLSIVVVIGVSWSITAIIGEYTIKFDMNDNAVKALETSRDYNCEHYYNLSDTPPMSTKGINKVYQRDGESFLCYELERDWMQLKKGDVICPT